MDVLFVVIGILTFVVTWIYTMERGLSGGILLSFGTAIVLVVTGSNISGIVSTDIVIEHSKVCSMPVDGGQLEFFSPVNVTETITKYPWYITGRDKSEFQVVK